MIRATPPGLTSGPTEWAIFPPSPNLSQYVSWATEPLAPTRPKGAAPDAHGTWWADEALVSHAEASAWMTAYSLYVGAQAALAEASRHYLDDGRGVSGLPTPQSRRAFESALARLLADGGPMPQPGLTYDGGIETRWLVAGRLLSVVANADGTTELYAFDSDGSVLFALEDEASAEAAATYRAATALLAAMGRQVLARVPTAR